MTEFINILSSAAIVIFFVAALPQIRRLLVNKTARDISLWTSILTATGNFMMLVRAIAVRDVFFSVNYAFQLGLWSIIIVLILKYHNR